MFFGGQQHSLFLPPTKICNIS